MEIMKMDITTLQDLQSFTTVEEMNEAVALYKSKHRLTETDRAILDVVTQYACKYTGVCYLSKTNIARAAGFKSRRTAIRACQRLEELGIVKQYETRRKNGDKRRSVNIIVIQPIEDRESQQLVTADSHTKEAPLQTPIKANTCKETYEETEFIYKRGLKMQIPAPFYQAFAPLFNARTLYDIYGILLRAKAKLAPYLRIEDYAEQFLGSFYNVIRLYKWGKIRHFKNYLYCTWERLAAHLQRKKLMKDRQIPEVYLYDYEDEQD